MLAEIANVIPQVLTIAGGSVGVFASTWVYKKYKGLKPQKNENKAIIRSVGVVMGVISTALIGFADGNVTPDTIQQGLVAVITVTGQVIGAHLLHKSLKK